jgi:hypothetical protein
MSNLHEMYEQLTRSIDVRMPFLVASLVPAGAITMAVKSTNESPMEVTGTGKQAEANFSQSSVLRGE